MSELTVEEIELLLQNKSDVQGRVCVQTVIDLLNAHDDAAHVGGPA